MFAWDDPAVLACQISLEGKPFQFLLVTSRLNSGPVTAVRYAALSVFD